MSQTILRQVIHSQFGTDRQEMCPDFLPVRQVLLWFNKYTSPATCKRLPKQALSYARKLSLVELLKICCCGEERAVPNSKISRLIEALNQTRFIFPPLKRLLFEVFWFLFAVVEIVRFLRSLL
jgi:hypothetical protein